MEHNIAIPDEVVANKIHVIRNRKVMIDRDLAELYGVKTKVLKQAVRRNLRRFPEDFMFEMTKEEFENWRSQFVTSNSDKSGLRYAPFCFSEQGVTMISCILNNERAIAVNIQVIRIFTRMRDTLLTHKELLLEMEEIRKKVAGQDDKITLIFNYLKQFITNKEGSRKAIGFKQNRSS